MKSQTTHHFVGTQKQDESLRKAIADLANEKGAMMQVLQIAQEIYGYLPIEVQRVIADEFKIPLSEVYGVVTFYSQFSLEPKGQYKVSICMGTACYVKGSDVILRELVSRLGIEVGQCTEDGKFSLDATRCIGACGLAPVIMVNNDVYGKVKKEEVHGIIEKYNV